MGQERETAAEGKRAASTKTPATTIEDVSGKYAKTT